MDTKSIARAAAIAKLHTPEISNDLARSLANDYQGFRTMNPDATLDEYLKSVGITQHRELYAKTVGHFVSVDDNSRGGMVMEECNVGPMHQKLSNVAVH